MTNPFDNDEQNNPFDTYQEPASPAYSPPAAAPSNPFEPSSSPAAAPSYNSPAPSYNSPAPSYNSPAPSYSAEPQVPSSTNKKGEFVDPVTRMKITNKDLDKREQELLAREAKLNSVEQSIANGTYQKPKADRNFPPYFRWWSWHPERDLPENSVKLVKIIRWIYLATILVYLVNWIGCLCCLQSTAAQATSSPATKIVLSTIFLFIFCPISFEISFFVLYKSLMNSKALRFFCFLFTYIIWFGILVFNLIGIDDSGSVGFIQMINVFSSSSLVGIIALIFCILGCLDGAAMVYSFIMLIKFYRANGIDKQAFKEGSKMAAGYANDHKKEIAEFAAENKEDIAGAAATGYAASGKYDI